MGGGATTLGGYFATNHQQRTQSVAAAKLIVQELARNRVRLDAFAETSHFNRLRLARSFRPERYCWRDHGVSLTPLIDNDTFATVAAAYVQIELAEIIGAGSENRKAAVEAAEEALTALSAYIERHEHRFRLAPNLRLVSANTSQENPERW